MERTSSANKFSNNMKAALSFTFLISKQDILPAEFDSIVHGFIKQLGARAVSYNANGNAQVIEFMPESYVKRDIQAEQPKAVMLQKVVEKKDPELEEMKRTMKAMVEYQRLMNAYTMNLERKIPAPQESPNVSTIDEKIDEKYAAMGVKRSRTNNPKYLKIMRGLGARI